MLNMTPLNSIYGVDSDFVKKEDLLDFTKFQRLTNSGCWACWALLLGHVVSKMVPIFCLQSSSAL